MSPIRWTPGFLIGLAAACFRPPTADVLFACDPATAPACPPGYTCQDDGCCHRDGTDPTENRGACMLFGPGTATGGATEGTATGTATATGSATGPGTAGSGTSATTGASTGTATGASGTSGATTSSSTDTGTSGGSDTGTSG